MLNEIASLGRDVSRFSPDQVPSWRCPDFFYLSKPERQIVDLGERQVVMDVIGRGAITLDGEHFDSASLSIGLNPDNMVNPDHSSDVSFCTVAWQDGQITQVFAPPAFLVLEYLDIIATPRQHFCCHQPYPRRVTLEEPKLYKNVMGMSSASEPVDMLAVGRLHKPDQPKGLFPQLWHRLLATDTLLGLVYEQSQDPLTGSFVRVGYDFDKSKFTSGMLVSAHPTQVALLHKQFPTKDQLSLAEYIAWCGQEAR